MTKWSEPITEQEQVFGVVALLDDEHTGKVHQILNVLERECGLVAQKVPPYPHISFHGAVGYDLDPLDQQLSAISRQIKPFKIHTAGLAVFTGAKPVIYIPVVMSTVLLEIHRLLWETTSQFGKRVNRLYQPGAWVPHITLLHHTVGLDCINDIFSQYLEESFAWEIEISRLAVIYWKNGEYGLSHTYSLSE